MTSATFDTLAVSKRLQTAGFSQAQAEALATEMQENAREDHLVTREYLDEKLRLTNRYLDEKLAYTHHYIDEKLDAMRQYIDTKLEATRDYDDNRLEKMELRLLVKLGAMFLASLGFQPLVKLLGG